MASRNLLPCCGLLGHFAFCAIASALVLRADDLGPPAQYEGQAVADVRFDPPTQPVASADLRRLVTLREGTPLRLADVRMAIKRLYATGSYSNVEIDADPAPAGLILVIRTTQQWFVGPVEVKGKINAPPNTGQFVGASRLDLGAPFDDGDLDTAVENLKKLMQRNGLYRGTVSPEIVRDAEHEQVSITFRVDAGKRARFMLPNILGDTRIPPSQVARAAKFKEIFFFPWKPATQAEMQTGLENIRRRYDKQDRFTADVALDRTDYLSETNRVRPTIHADGGPKIKIDADGAKVSQGNLHKYVPVFDEGAVYRDLLVRGASNLRDYFQSRGYFDVQVDVASHDVNRDLEVITYTVGLGENHRVVSVHIAGNRYFTTAEIRQHMFIQPKGLIRLRHGRYSHSFAARDEQTIQALYRDSGFRDCRVATRVTDDHRGKKGDVAVTVTIEEGAQYVVGHLAVNGLTLKNKDAILSHLSSSSGQPFSETTVAIDRGYILEQCRSAGYPNVEFEFRATPSGPHRFDVSYLVTETSPEYVRDVLVSGLHTTSRRLVDPLISLHPGDPLSLTEMGNMQRRLYNLGVFENVDMAVQDPDGDTEQKYVDFHLVEGHLYTMAIGVGAELAQIGGNPSSVSNPTGTSGVAPRFDLQLSRLNMWGLGHSVIFNGRYSTLDRRAELSYAAPRFRNVEGRNITVSGLYDNTRDVLTFTAVRYQGALQVTQRVGKATNLLFRYSWTDDRVDQSTLKINPLLIPLYSQPAQVGVFAANLVQDRRDNPVDAHRGIYNSLDLGLADTQLGGNKNFLRFLGRNSYYKTVAGDIVLASNTEFGVIRPFSTGGIASDNYVPLPERFFSGGEDSIRAFPINQAGPRDLDTGFPLGGNAVLFHSTEVRFPLIGDNISGVVFHDMGNVYSGLSSISFRVHQNGLTDFNYMVHAVGFGIRYRTPLGPIRVDLAYSINPPTFNGLQGTYQQLLFGGATQTVQSVGHFQYFFSIGQAF
jgi:outer membrane protein assembly complex protein YaeT